MEKSEDLFNTFTNWYRNKVAFSPNLFQLDNTKGFRFMTALYINKLLIR